MVDSARATASKIITFTPTQAREYTSELIISGGGITKSVVLVGEGHISPTLTATPSSLDFGTVIVGSPNPTLTVNVTASNLTEDITVALSGSASYSLERSPWNARTGGTITITYDETVGTSNGTLVISADGITRSIPITGVGVEANLILESTAAINIPEATASLVNGATKSFYIPSGTIVNTPIVCNNILTKASDITLMDVDLEYTGTTNLVLDGISIYDFKLNNASGDSNLTVSYRNSSIQNLTSTGWRTESIINLEPYDNGEPSSIDLAVAQTFTGNNFQVSTLKVTYSSTSSAAFNLTNQTGEKNTANSLEIVGAGDTVLYQYSVDNSSFREIIVRTQTVSTLGLVSGIDFTTVVSILFDDVKFLGTALQTLTDTIVNTKPSGSNLTITFENGSDTFTAEQVTALEAVNVTIITTNN